MVRMERDVNYLFLDATVVHSSTMNMIRVTSHSNGAAKNNLALGCNLGARLSGSQDGRRHRSGRTPAASGKRSLHYLKVQEQ